jgi:aryl-alcohol dehydrogenase-like predicted oxidoreductase
MTSNGAGFSFLGRFFVEQRTLGNSGIRVGAIGLGCMGMSDFYGPTDDVESVATLHLALDRGANLVDTADMYGFGKNEELVGKVVRARRKDVVLATKFGIVRDAADPTKRGFNGKPEYVRTACEASLKRLGVDVIDLYYQHRVDTTVPIEETVGAMAELLKAGKVRALGLSEASAETLRRANAIHPIAALQSEYSLWTRDPEDGVLATCRALDIAFVAYSPLGRGFLTGAIRQVGDLAADDYRRQTPRFQVDNLAANLELVKRVEAFASKKGSTPAQLALAWVLAKGQDIIPIPGTKRRKRLEENLAAVDIRLSEDEVAALSAVIPRGAVAGPRYPEAMQRAVGR